MDHNQNSERQVRTQHRQPRANAAHGKDISVVSAILTGRRSRSIACIVVALVVALTTVVTVAASIVSSHRADSEASADALAADGAKTAAVLANDTKEPEAKDTEEAKQTDGEKNEGSNDAKDDGKSADTEEKSDDAEKKDDEAKDPNAHTVVITFDEQENFVGETTASTLGEFILSSGVVLNDAQLANLDLDAKIDSDMTFVADRVSYDTITEDEPIPFETEYRDSTDIAAGTQSVLQWGVNGVMTKSYDVKYVNGIETVRVQTGAWVSEAAVDQVVLNGITATVSNETPTTAAASASGGGGSTAGANGLPAETVYESGYVTGKDGTSYHYYAYLDVQATCYIAGGTTASGLPADENVIGVGRYDGTLTPIIPFGTTCYVKGDYADIGVRTSADYGGMFGNRIDVCLYPTNPLFANFGWRSMRVYLLG